MKDLFGQDITVEQYLDNGNNAHDSEYMKFKKRNGYTKSWYMDKRCGKCAHCFSKGQHGKNYYKCDLMGCSASPATDIRVGHVCNLFKKGEV